MSRPQPATSNPAPAGPFGASTIYHLDTTAVEALEEVCTALQERGIAPGSADLHSRTGEMFEQSGLAERIGRAMPFDWAEAAAASFEGHTTTKQAVDVARH